MRGEISIRRWLKRTAIGLAALLGLVLVLAASTLVALSTPWGSERLRRLAVGKVNAALAGSVAIERLDFRVTRLALHGVRLRDPDGKTVAEVGSLEVAISLPPLLHKTIDVARIHAVDPRLFIRQDEEGLNLARAIAPRIPAAPEQQPAQKSALSIVLRQFLLENGSLQFLRVSDGGDQELRLDKLAMDGKATMKNGGDQLEAELAVGAQLHQPLEAPLELKVSAGGDGDKRQASVSLKIADSELIADADSNSAEDARVQLKRLRLSPRVARAVLPGYPVLVPVGLEGEATKEGVQLSTHFKAAAGSASLSLSASGALAGPRRAQLDMQLADLNLRQLIRGPASHIRAELHADGSGNELDDLDANVRLRVPESKVDSQLLGPIRITAQARRGQLQLTELVGHLPGVNLRGAGHGSRQHLEASLQVDAYNLDLLAKTFGLKRKAPRIGGNGKIRVALGGQIKHPSINVDVRSDRLRFGNNQATRLAVSASIPDLTSPLQARLSATSGQVDLDRRSYKRVRLAVASERSQFAVDAEAHGFADLRFHLDGSWDADRRGLLLSHFILRYPEAEWTLTSPAKVAFRRGEISAKKLALRSGTQSISLSGEKNRNRVSASLDLESFDLARLPKAFLDPTWNLKGLVTAQARASGTLAHPTLSLRLDLRNGQYKNLAKLFVNLDGTYQGDRARGRLNARGDGVDINVDFDAPIRGLLKGRHEPVRVSAALEELNLDSLARNLGLRFPLGGRVAGRVALSGTADEPRLNAQVTGRRIQYQQAPPLDLALAIETAQDDKLAARASLELDGNKNWVEMKTPYRLGRLIRQPPREAEAMRIPFELRAEVRSFPLPLLFELGMTEQEIQGKVDVTAKVVGPVAAPAGDLKVDIAGVSTGDMAPADVHLVASAKESGAHATLAASQQKQPIVNLIASLGAPTTRLANVEAIANSPLEVKGTLGPIALKDIQRLLKQPNELDNNPPKLNGTAAGNLSCSGSLRDPRLQLHLRIDSLGPDPQKVANVELSYDYKRSQNNLKVNVNAWDQSSLQLAGQSTVDLSYPALATGIRFADAPVKAQLQAKALNLAFLSGVSPEIRRAGGQLDASASVEGTIGHPRLQGQVELRQGLLALLGYGDFKDIHLQLTGDSQRIELKELTARSGKGEAKIYILAQSAERDRFSLHSTVDLNGFPLMMEDQLLANISLKSSIDGMVSSRALNFRQISIPEAHIELPDVEHKDVRKLSEAKDVVFFRNGRALRQAKEDIGGSSAVAGAESSPNPPFHVRAVIDAPRNIWVRGKDVNAEFGLSEGFRVESNQTLSVFGDVTVVRGRVDVFGKRFDFQRSQKISKISFTGPPATPTIDLTAAYKNSNEQVTIYVNVTGTATHISLSPTSDPPLTETEIYTILATGHRSLRPGTGKSSAGGEAASIVGSVVASQLKSTLSDKLPLDVISIEAGDQGVSGTKVEVGTYVNDKLYLGFKARIGADPLKRENANAIRLEYQLGKRWAVEGEYGDAKVGSADLVWTKSY